MNYKKLIISALLAMVLQASAQEPVYVGGDISLLLTYEEHGATYMDKDGQKITDLLSFLKEQGMNAMRVRLFVDPSRASAEHKGQGVRQDLDYVKKLGKKIKDAGLKLMLDFHYSDTWADPDNLSVYDCKEAGEGIYLRLHQGLSGTAQGCRGCTRFYTDG